MIKKVDILGIQLDNYTVREAIMCEFPGSCNHWRERDYSGSGA